MEILMNFQENVFYDVIVNTLATIFYILLVICIFYKLYIAYYVKKINCKNDYIAKKNEIINKRKDNKKGKLVRKVLIGILLGCVTIFVITLIVNILILIFTGLGVGLENTENIIMKCLKKIMDISILIWEYLPVIIWMGVTFLIYELIYSFLLTRIYIFFEFLKEKKNKKG